MTTVARARATRWIAAGALALASCSSAGLPDLGNLAEQPPLPYSVLVTGGAFVDSEQGGGLDVPALQRTYRPKSSGDEAFPLRAVVDVLRQGRVFVTAVEDGAPALVRRQIAAHTGQPIAALDDHLRAARQGGHDLLLVVERLEDRFVEYRGVNGQWPITFAVWILVGLGLVIPDHTYESHASLVVSLRDVQNGRAIDSWVLSGGTVDLALIDRTGLLGLATSIIVPPFWVADDDEIVETTVRDVSSVRLLESLARQLKSVDVQAALRGAFPVHVALEIDGDVLRVRVVGRESISFVRVRVDAETRRDPEFDAFQRRLLDSVVEQDGQYSYHAQLPRPRSGSTVQLLLQTVAGRVASTTVALPR